MKNMKNEKFSEISNIVIGCAIEVHRELGPGLLESTYEHCLAYELMGKGLEIKRQHVLPVIYKKTILDCSYRVDLLVDNEIIVELKSVEAINGVHQAQLLSYMKLAKVKHGLLINFNVQMLKDGLKSFIL